MSEKTYDADERKKLIQDIANIKDVLDSYKYGLNFEEFADALFQTIDRQTIAVKNLSQQMDGILRRMENLEAKLEEGIKVRVKGLSSDMMEGQDEVVLEGPIEAVEASESETEAASSFEELRAEKADLETKISRLFEKENELTEMALNDPASAEEYEEKAKVARDMRLSLEERLGVVENSLKKDE